MPKPTTMNGWWKKLLDQAANGRVQLLAKLLDVSPRTLHRWQTADIKIPNLERRQAIRRLAGILVDDPDCPRYLRLKKASARAKTPTNR